MADRKRSAPSVVQNQTSGAGSPRRRAVPSQPPSTDVLPDPSGKGPSILPEPTAPQLRSVVQQKVATFRGANVPLPAIYGQNETGGIIVLETLTDTGLLLVVYKVCHGPINSLTFKVDGRTPESLGMPNQNALIGTTYPGGPGYMTFTGTKTQGLATLVSKYVPGWTSTYPGQAYAAMIFPSTYVGQQPPNHETFVATVQGLLVRDPRTDATLVNRYYRNNPALVWADLKSSKRYGEGYADSEIDWLGDVITAANDCDFDIGGGTKRYTMDYKLDASMALDPAPAMENVRAHAALNEVYNGGKWHVWVDKVVSASGVDFTDLGTGANLEDAFFRLRGQGELPTRVRVEFVNASNSYRDDSAETPNPGIAAGTVEDVPYTYRLNGVSTYDQAKRLATLYLNRSALDKEYTLLVGPEGAQLLPGVRFTVSHSDKLGITSSTDFLCVSSAPRGSRWEVMAELYSASVYSDTIVAGTVNTVPTFPSPFDVSAPPEKMTTGFATEFGGVSLAIYPPQRRTALTTTSGMWTATGGSGFDATKISDGNKTVAAWNGVGGAATLLLDFGAAVSIRAIQVWSSKFNPGSAGRQGWHMDRFSYSDNGSTYTNVFTADPQYQEFGADSDYAAKGIYHTWDDVSAHRYWKFRFQQEAGFVGPIPSIMDVQVYTFQGAHPYIKSYDVYDMSSGAPKLFASVPNADYVTNPLQIPPSLVRSYTSSTLAYFEDWASLRVVAITTSGLRSDPIDTCAIDPAGEVAVPLHAAMNVGASAPYTPYLTFESARERVLPPYGASAWSNVQNLGSFVAASVNDGILTNQAFTVSAFQTCILGLDAGSAIYVNEVQIDFYSSTSPNFGQAVLYQIAHSDDGVSFTSLSTDGNTMWTTSMMPPDNTRTSMRVHVPVDKEGLTHGAHRYWRFTFDPVAYSIADFQIVQYGSSRAVDHYELLDCTNNDRPTVAKIAAPSGAGNTLVTVDLSPYVKQRVYSGIYNIVSVDVVAVSRIGKKSSPRGHFKILSQGSVYLSAIATVQTTETLSNKTLDDTNSATFKDNAFTLEDDASPTKKATFQLSSITAGQTRVQTIPDTDQILAGRNVDNAFSVSQTFNAKVGIGVAPSSTIALKVAGPANDWTEYLLADATTGQSYGLLIDAGTNSSDLALRIRSRGGTDYLKVTGDGNTQVLSGFLGVGGAPGYRLHLINPAATGSVSLRSDGTTTAQNYALFTNTAAVLYLGIESNTGGNIITGSTAYSCIIGDGNNRDFHLISNAAIRMTIKASGDIHFNGSNASYATNATAGFPFMPVMGGTPTGTPTLPGGNAPFVYDNSAHKFWIYDSATGTWKWVAMT